MINDILTLDQQWLPNQSGFPQISWHWYRVWPSPIMIGAFSTGVAYKQGTLTLPDTWFRPPLWDLLVSNCWDQIPRTCHVFTRLLTSNIPSYFLDVAKLYIIINVSRLIWHTVVFSKIFQSRKWVNWSAQGSYLKVTTKHGAFSPLTAHGRCESEMHKKVEDDKLHSFQQFQTSACGIFNFRYPYLVLKWPL